MAKAVITINGMHCSSCRQRVERALARAQGVTAARVDLAAGQATVEYAPERTSEAEIKEAVRGLGYRVP